MCGEIWAVVARTHYPQSFTLLGSIRPQVLVRLSCSDGDAIQVGAIYVGFVVIRRTKGIRTPVLVALDCPTDLSVVCLSNREEH